MTEMLQPLPDDPVLGKFVQLYTTNRLRLLIQGSLAYVGAVVGLQLLFWQADETLSAIALPILFAVVAMGIFWMLAHVWNRETVLYERGFSYRRGSQVGMFRYEQITVLALKAERVTTAGIWKRDVYHCQMWTEQDEQLSLNNLYGDIADLVTRLEIAITNARFPIVKAQFAQGERLQFGVLALSLLGIDHEEASLAWENYTGYTLKGGMMAFHGWDSIPLENIHNLRVLLRLLKERENA